MNSIEKCYTTRRIVTVSRGEFKFQSFVELKICTEFVLHVRILVLYGFNFVYVVLRLYCIAFSLGPVLLFCLFLCACVVLFCCIFQDTPTVTVCFIKEQFHSHSLSADSLNASIIMFGFF